LIDPYSYEIDNICQDHQSGVPCSVQSVQ